jgi:hypothetical protein
MLQANEREKGSINGGTLKQLVEVIIAAAWELICRVKPRHQRWQVINIRTGKKRRM